MHRAAFSRRAAYFHQQPWAQHPFAPHAYYYRFGRRPGMGLFKLAIVGAGAYFVAKKVVRYDKLLYLYMDSCAQQY